ncbi:Forkhead box protein I1 [Linnemannia gamsii]|uniref:Forkhead box protein I1 n=1 Tax=Linnemannia gamsii TaxID=64522 RepID=A0A9P6RGT3_9FUNG|nr:Forkhead box protein I1 [Linnemannia gamsii]
MTSEHAERTSVPSHANASEPASSTHGLPYGVSRTSSSSHLPPHSSSSTASLSSVSGSISVYASSPSSSSAIAAGSAGRSVPAGSTTSSVTVTTTASGEIKTTRRRRRPNESYSTIIIKAIRNSPLQRLKLSEIYDYVSREIPTMDGNDKGWQNTVRHNLSHNKCFRRIVLKDEDMPSGSADDDDGESRQSASNTGKSSKQAKRGKGGCWVLVPENLEESMSSSRPKKSSTDQGQSPAALGATGSALISSTSPKKHHHTPGPSGEAIFPKATTKSATGSTGANLSPQLSKEYTHSHPHSSMMDIDRNVASMMIAEQQFQQSGRSSSTTFQTFTPITRLGQQHNYSSGEDKDHGSESDDGQSGHSVLSADRENDGDYEEDEAMDAMEEDEDSVSHSSSSRRSPSCSPSASSLSATASSPMEIEEMDGGNGGLSSSSSPTTDRRRPGMSIQNMLN